MVFNIKIFEDDGVRTRTGRCPSSSLPQAELADAMAYVLQVGRLGQRVEFEASWKRAAARERTWEHVSTGGLHRSCTEVPKRAVYTRMEVCFLLFFCDGTRRESDNHLI